MAHDGDTGGYDSQRRRLIQLALLGGVAMSRASAAQEPSPAPSASPTVPAAAMPIVDARHPAEMAPGVFVLPDRRISLVPNIGIIVGRDAVLVIDCGLGVESAERVLDVTRRLAPGRRIVLTVTHAHPEHGFGAQVFRSDARIFYNRAQADYFARSGATLLAGFRADVLPIGQKQVLDGIVITPPHETYDGATATIDLGGRRVSLRTWGTAHSPGDQIVHLQQEGIVFAGDLLEERMFPIIPLFPPMIAASDIDVARWEVVLAEIIRLEPRLIVPGHGNLGGPEIATDVLGYLREVRALVRGGASQIGLADRIRARHPTWEHSEFIGPALRYFSLGRS